MDIEYIHFYVDDALAWRDWFTHRLGFTAAGGWRDRHNCHEPVYSGTARFLLSSAHSNQGPIAQYLAQHPQGVVDVALRVTELSQTVARAIRLGSKLLQPITPLSDRFHKPSERIPTSEHTPIGEWATLSGWGHLQHTLIQRTEGTQTQSTRRLGRLDCSIESSAINFGHINPAQFPWPLTAKGAFQRIDHCVLNVAAGDLNRAVEWYRQLFNLSPQQSFHIKTPNSSLHSQVLVGNPLSTSQNLAGQNHRLQIPINEPASANSQIQEFLDHNRGPGIQHIALLTDNLLPTVAQLRNQGINFLTVPSHYYDLLPLRPKFREQGLAQEWDSIRTQQALVDWHLERQEGSLLQIFTEPIFPEPTFFLELIERRSLPLANHSQDVQPLNQVNCYAQGFGEGNFQALFEAIEQAQQQRNSLKQIPPLSPA